MRSYVEAGGSVRGPAYPAEYSYADDTMLSSSHQQGPCAVLTPKRSVEIELVALDVLHHDARLVVVIGKQ